MSKLPKISEIWFGFESKKKKRFEKSPNVCKWLKIYFNRFPGSFNDHFKPIYKALALKTAEIQPCKTFISFYWILNILNRDKNCGNNINDRAALEGRADRVDHADRIDHAYRVGLINGDNIIYYGNVNRLHVGFDNCDRIDYNGESGKNGVGRAGRVDHVNSVHLEEQVADVLHDGHHVLPTGEKDDDNQITPF